MTVSCLGFDWQCSGVCWRELCLCTTLQCAIGCTEEVNRGKASPPPPSLARDWQKSCSQARATIWSARREENSCCSRLWVCSSLVVAVRPWSWKPLTVGAQLCPGGAELSWAGLSCTARTLQHHNHDPAFHLLSYL